MIIPSEKDVAWFAGLFEGEGCLTFVTDRKSGGGSWRLCLHSTDEDIVLRIQDLFGGKVRLDTAHKKKTTYKPIWQWALYRKDEINKIVTVLYPYMGIRRKAKFDEFLAYYNNPVSKSEVMRRNWQNPEYRQKMIAERKARWQNPEWRAKHMWTIQKAAEARWPENDIRIQGERNG